MSRKKKNGFSIVELIIVLAIIGIIASIGAFAWQRYVENTNLRTAARDIVTDFNTMKRRAVSEYAAIGASQVTPTYTMVFSISGNHYVMNKTYNDGTGNITEVIGDKQLAEQFGHGIEFQSFGGGGSTYSIGFTARGIMNPAGGFIVLVNNRNSTARITFNATGKTYVTFAMH